MGANDVGSDAAVPTAEAAAPDVQAKQCAPSRYRLPNTTSFQDINTPDGQVDSKSHLRDFLLSSLQLQHLVVLAGSGTSLAAGYPSMRHLWEKVVQIGSFEATKKLVDYPSAQGIGNIEELLSRCDALLQLRDEKKVQEFRKAAVQTILDTCRKEAPPEKLTAHKTFLHKLARRRARDSRFKLFTTNYDLCFENAAGELGLVPIDGFSYSYPRRFDPRYFEYDIVRRGEAAESTTFVPGVFQYFKLHGSVSWATKGGYTTIQPDVGADDASIIYPARAKFQRSYEQPHLELMARYLSSLREPNSSLVVVGCGFNDDHLAKPIFAALETNPHFRMIVVDPSAEQLLSGSDPHWQHLNELAGRSDLAILNVSFERFAELVPDLRALTPQQELARAVQKVAASAGG